MVLIYLNEMSYLVVISFDFVFRHGMDNGCRVFLDFLGYSHTLCFAMVWIVTGVYSLICLVIAILCVSTWYG